MASWVGCHVSHSYPTGASLYFTFGCLQRAGREIDQYLHIKKAAEDAFMKNGGTLSHHHAVGTEHLPWVEEDVSPTGLKAVRAVKEGLDPRGIMNPGKIIPPGRPVQGMGPQRGGPRAVHRFRPMSFAGQTVAITGASSGLGLHLARQLATHGARLAPHGPRRGPAAGKPPPGWATTRSCSPGDVTSENDCRQFIGEIVAEHGALDHLIANAGQSMWARFEEIENLELLRRLIEVNYLGVAHCIHAALPALRKKPRAGRGYLLHPGQGRRAVPLRLQRQQTRARGPGRHAAV